MPRIAPYPIFCLLMATLLLSACNPIEQDTKKTPIGDHTQQQSSWMLANAQSHLDWKNCHHHGHWFDEIHDVPTTLQCATLVVPLDNARPQGKTLTLALTRLPATTDDPLGSLLIIAGGPGDTSLDTVVTSFGDSWAIDDIKSNFDIIGFAPRGILPSKPAIDCGDEYQSDANSFVQACIKHSGNELLSHISTQDAILDIERIRIALGEKRLSLIGYSYGSKVLARYVERFPTSVRAAVFDGIVDVTEDYFTAWAGQKRGFQATFERFAKYCTDFEACPFDDATHYKAGFWGFLTDIDEKQLKDSDGEAITGDDVLALIEDNMLWQSDWDTIMLLIEELQDNNTELYNLLTNSDPNDNSNDKLGLVVINCADGSPKNKDNYLHQVKTLGALSVYNHYRHMDDEEYLDACYYWNNVGTDTNDSPVISPHLPQVLFVAQKHDPTTPYQNALHMAQLFNAPLITRNGDGHTLVLTDDSSCVDDAVVGYLKSPTTLVLNQTCD